MDDHHRRGIDRGLGRTAASNWLANENVLNAEGTVHIEGFAAGWAVVDSVAALPPHHPEPEALVLQHRLVAGRFVDQA